jgi:hypothetical protein
MRFTNTAKRWLQSINHKIPQTDWITLCAMIHERFCQDQHELLLHRLFQIKMSGSVQDYID